MLVNLGSNTSVPAGGLILADRKIKGSIGSLFYFERFFLENLKTSSTAEFTLCYESQVLGSVLIGSKLKSSRSIWGWIRATFEVPYTYCIISATEAEPSSTECLQNKPETLNPKEKSSVVRPWQHFAEISLGPCLQVGEGDGENSTQNLSPVGLWQERDTHDVSGSQSIIKVTTLILTSRLV